VPNVPPEDGGGAQNVFGRASLPSGSGGTLSKYKVVGLRQEYRVGTDGSFAVFMHDSGVNPVWLVDEQGRLAFAGLLNSHTPEENSLSEDSTAVVLLFYALGGPSLPPGWQTALLESLQDHPETAKLATAISNAYAADRGTFENPSSPIIAALEAALNSAPPTTINSPAMAQQSRGFVEIDPEGRRDGIGVDSEEAPELRLTNSSLRNATYYLYRTGYETNDVDIAVDPPELVGSSPLPGLYKVNLEEARAWYEYWLGELDEIEDDAEVPGFAIEVLEAEDDQLVVHYHLVVASGHIPDLATVPDWWTASENPNKQEWLEESQRMPALGLVKNVFLPVVFTMSLPFGKPLAQDLTAEEADAFIDEMQAYVPDLRDLLDSGEWDLAVRKLMVALAQSELARASFDARLNAWIGAGTHYSTDEFWDALDGGEVYLQAQAAGIKRTAVAGVLESHRDAEMLSQWDIAYKNSKMALSTTDDTVDPTFSWTQIQAKLEGEPEEYCLRYTLMGPGCIVTADEFDCGGTTNKLLVTTDTEIHYAVHEVDLVEGATVTILAEFFESSCAELSGSLRSTDSVEIVQHEFPDPEPCDRSEFDLGWWQEKAGYGVSAHGTLGGTITTTVSFSAADDNPAWVEVFVPGAYDTDTGRITVSGGGDDMLWGAQPFGSVYLDVRRDEAGLPVRVPVAMQISISHATSTVTVTCPSKPLDLIECPYVIFDENVAEQHSLTGPLVGVKMKFGLPTIDIVGVPAE
jgi:hypothetical protein